MGEEAVERGVNEVLDCTRQVSVQGRGSLGRSMGWARRHARTEVENARLEGKRLSSSGQCEI